MYGSGRADPARAPAGWLGYFDAAFRDPAGDVRPDPTVHRGSDAPGAEITEIQHLATAVRDAQADGLAGLTVHMPQLGGALPGPLAVDLLLVEVLGHTWDLARATGQPWQPDPAAAEHALGVLRATLRPEYRGDGLPFGPEVPIAADAPAIDRLVAFTGRSPGWAPPA